MTELVLGPLFSLPPDAATRRMAVVATSGAGKSNTAVRMAEQMTAAGIPWYAIDVKGDWWGVRTSANGKRPGLPVVIFGGDYGDVALLGTAGKVVAETVSRQRLSSVIDVSHLQTQERYGFLADFADTLLRINREPLHGFLDECHRYIPQTMRDKGEQMRCLGRWEDLVTGGRSRGLGTTQISQRAALVNKNTLDIVEAMVAMRTMGPRDRDVVKDWLTQYLDPVKRDAIMRSLPSLGNGEAWFYAPEWTPGDPRRVQFARRETFDSAATPEVGKSITPPSTRADVDLAALGERMRETIERQQADDPKVLRATIAGLRRELAAQPTAVADPVEVRIEVPVFDDVAKGEIRALREAAEKMARDTRSFSDNVDFLANLIPEAAVAPVARAVVPRAVRPLVAKPRTVEEHTHTSPPRSTGESSSGGTGDRAVLDVLLDFPEGRTRDELAFLAGYSAKASTIGNILGRLRAAGLVNTGTPIRLTEAGVAAAGGPRARLTGDELLEKWLHHPRMGDGDRRVLEVLIAEYPRTLTRDELCDATGYSPTASTIGNILGRLRTLGLVERRAYRCADAFMEAIAS